MQLVPLTLTTWIPIAKRVNCAPAHYMVSSIVDYAPQLSKQRASPSSFRTVSTSNGGANFMFSAHSSCSPRCTIPPRRPVLWTLTMACSVPFTKTTASCIGDLTTCPCSTPVLTTSLITVKVVPRPDGCVTILSVTLVHCSMHT